MRYPVWITSLFAQHVLYTLDEVGTIGGCVTNGLYRVFATHALMEGAQLHTVHGQVRVDDREAFVEWMTAGWQQLCRAYSPREESDDTYVCDEGVMNIEAGHAVLGTEWNIELTMVTMSEKCAHQANDYLSTLTEIARVRSRAQTNVAMLTQNPEGLEVMDVGSIRAPLERGNYTPTQLAQFDRIVAEFRKDTPSGRLAILAGVQGSGKTYFVQGLATECECRCLLIPATMLDDLQGPSLLSALISLRQRRSWKHERTQETETLKLLLIVEDADHCLLPRELDNLGVLSTLLNLADGIVGRVLDVRIIATTNARLEGIDKALMRPGRLLEHVKFDQLSSEHAREVWQRLGGAADAQLGSRCTLADVYGALGALKK